MNYWQSSTNNAQQPTLFMAWLPVLVGLTIICFESTRTMSAANTGQWLLTLCHWLWGQTEAPSIDLANLVLRKLGHFCGYGMLGLLFRRAWLISLRRHWEGSRSRLPFFAAMLAVICTFAVACMDEVHQHFLPGRSSSFHDVLLDTAGSIFFTWGLMQMLALRRRRLLESYTV